MSVSQKARAVSVMVALNKSIVELAADDHDLDLIEV